MNCKHCGVFNVDGANYCRGCGKQLSNNQKSTNMDLTSNDKGREKNKNSPLTDMKNKLDKLSYGIIVLTVSLVMACLMPFVYDAEKDYSLSLIDLLPEMDSYSSAYQEGMNSAEVGSVLILVFSALGVFLAVRRKPLQNTVLLSILFCVWYIYDTRNDWTGLDISLAEGGYLYCVVPVVIFCMSIKQYSLQKNIKELTLYYKANGIMEYTVDDFIFCPFCNKKEFVKESGYCRNCDFEGDYKSVKYIHYMIVICALENLIAALLTTNSNWIEIFSIVRLGNETIQKIYSLDVAMCVIYWILLAFWLMPAIAASEQNEKTFLYFLSIYSVLTIAVTYHIFALANILPYEYSEGCKVCGFIIIIGNVIEIISIIKQWKNAKPFFCKKYGPKAESD